METRKVSRVSNAQDGQRAQMIVDEARKRFFQAGFSKVTLAELADELGMSKKTLYRYYASKEVLFRAVIETNQQNMEEVLDRVLDDAVLDFAEKLSRMVAVIGQRLGAVNPGAFVDFRRSAPIVWRDAVKVWQRIVREHLVRLLNQGRRDGYIWLDLHSGEFVLLRLIEIVQQAFYTEQIVPFTLTPAEGFKILIKVLLEGLLTSKGRAHFKLKFNETQKRERSRI